ncbi:chemotaxis protein CheW [Geomonas ferrireducens]|uniref:chemotaxis protein CheW n=1 Tax=Geomonas ferrireducens TaxID=2570227 RepID=UPI0010A772D9|nr:chemotaxis protein CheW [Geomonas ferrireducens]
MTAERLLVFSVGRELFALNLTEVCEVMEPQQSYPFAGAPPYYLGLINFHGNLTALLDFAQYLGAGSRPLPGRLLVIDTKRAHLALKVDAVGSIIDAQGIIGATRSDDPLIEALLETTQGNLRLVRLETLLSSLEEDLRAAAPKPASGGN